ncbi:hypothetical protein [Limnohabitans planktonicus]|uniref:DUF3551 domain-containing protein n=1 Tax=Limnohabitans planktonicus II-D5 TaxID=1293045 RepID=A0A2T7U8N3_9BURK|nr:hypothetical protein [Limnohabitans planktonicus]PVE41022.1 hypothetical protein H663_019455 [Limnohabitans planktonicus II-D5]
MQNKSILAHAVLSVSLALSGGMLYAQSAPGGDSRRPPPPEALAACKTLKSGKDCSFNGPHGSVQGTCWAPADKPLACKPRHMPAGGMPAQR